MVMLIHCICSLFFVLCVAIAINIACTANVYGLSARHGFVQCVFDFVLIAFCCHRMCEMYCRFMIRSHFGSTLLVASVKFTVCLRA
jgi:hypothetical protein